MKKFGSGSLTLAFILAGAVAIGCSSNSSGNDDDDDDNNGGSGGTSSGDDDDDDDNSANNCDDLDPKPGAGGSVPDVIISEVVHGQGIELYNTTDEDIELTDDNFFLCSQLEYTAESLKSLADGETVIPAKGYLMVSYPTEFKKNTEDIGEVVLFADASFFKASSAWDYVCWGEIPTDDTSRREMAAGGKDLFEGDCVAKPTNGSITRKAGTTGEDADSYDVEADKSLENCGG